RSGATWLGQVYAGAVMDEVGWPAQGSTGEGMFGGPSPTSSLSPPPELLAPCIAYVEADWMLRRIQALRALVLKATRSALDAVGVFEDAWREIVGLATRLNDEARASGGALPFCDIALGLVLEAEALDAVGMLARAARAGPRRGLLLVRMPVAETVSPGPVKGPDPASIAMAAAADLATLSGYEQRTASRARRARRAIEAWRRDHRTSAPLRQEPAAPRRTPEGLVAAIASALGEPAKGDMASRRRQQERNRQERARQERCLRDLAPAKDRTGLAVRALVWDGLLEDAGWALIAAAQEAVLLDHGTLSRRFIRLASIAVARHAAWRAMVFTLADIQNFCELQEIMRKRRQGEELIRQALEAFQDIEPTVRRRIEAERRREKIRANEPGGEGVDSDDAGTTEQRAEKTATNEPDLEEGAAIAIEALSGWSGDLSAAVITQDRVESFGLQAAAADHSVKKSPVGESDAVSSTRAPLSREELTILGFWHRPHTAQEIATLQHAREAWERVRGPLDNRIGGAGGQGLALAVERDRPDLGFRPGSGESMRTNEPGDEPGTEALVTDGRLSGPATHRGPDPHAPASKSHPWDGIVPPERRGAGTMTDPLIRPEPIQWVSVPSRILPGANPVAADNWRVRDRQPAPQRLASSLGPTAHDHADDDEDHEWVPRSGDRLGFIRVPRRRR
ncbi:hypothetical protein, partial [Alsobacter sp. R-9]